MEYYIDTLSNLVREKGSKLNLPDEGKASVTCHRGIPHVSCGHSAPQRNHHTVDHQVATMLPLYLLWQTSHSEARFIHNELINVHVLELASMSYTTVTV